MDHHEGLGPEGSYYEAKMREEERDRRRKGDAMFPLMITALFLFLGVVFHLWHPGWLLFLTIPLRYMHFNSRVEKFTNPVMVTLIYLIMGCFFGLWHPGWLIFLAIPFGAIASR